MEIPYTVSARPDTGLYNAKVGIWLFLASEVMLFGGLFSSYVFLRIGADFPWPRHELVVLPGFINTMVLIASSVSVISAWAALKARRYGWYQINMLITLFCALGFMGIKSYEYWGKFHHYSVIMQDGTVLDGHPLHESESEAGDKVAFTGVQSFSVNLEKSTTKFMRHQRIDDGGAKPYGEVAKGTHIKVRTPEGKEAEFTQEWLDEHKKAFRKMENLRSDLATIQARVDEPKVILEDMKRAMTGDYPVPYDAAKAEKLNARYAKLSAEKAPEIARLKAEISQKEKERPDVSAKTLTLQVVGAPLTFLINERDFGKYGPTEVVFRDDVVLTGKVKEDHIALNADLIDLRQVKNPEKSLAWKYYPELKEPFFAHNKQVTEAFLKKHPEHANDYEKNPDWQHDALRVSMDEIVPKEQAKAIMEDHAKAVEIERTDKRYYSNFSPSRSPYYAIYFLMTGLHGLHVIGGALVLGYFLVTGASMYKRDPEHLANRVEVGGLFWHFVDLVWIFLFPVFYLM